MKPSRQQTPKRPRLSPSQFSSQKVLYCCLRTGFHPRTTTRLCLYLILEVQMAAKAKRQSASLPSCQILPQWTFSLLGGETGAGELQDEPVGGHQSHRQRRARHCHSTVYGPPRTVRPNQLWLGLKKSWNNGTLKMIRIEVISPCAFDSDHTLDVHLFIHVTFILSSLTIWRKYCTFNRWVNMQHTV